LERHRLVFWYDAAQEWDESFETFVAEGVIKVRVNNDEFGTKVRIVRQPDTRYLIYVPGPKPADGENWLLDLLLQGHEYRADRASLALQEVGLPQDFRSVVEEHSAFFNSAKRVQALRELLAPDDQLRDVRLKMMSVLAGAPPDVDSLLVQFLGVGAEGSSADPAADALAAASLTQPFWREVSRLFSYSAVDPTVRDFAVTLFRGANPIDYEVKLQAHARVFLRQWKDSQAHGASFEKWSRLLERELQVDASLDAADTRIVLGDNDTFELFEKFTLHRLAELFRRGAQAAELRRTIQERRTSFWRKAHADGYDALEHAVTFRELLEAAELSVESIESGVRRYVTTWWQIDLAYRRCMYHLRRYNQVQLMEPVREWVERKYVNDFLLPLSDRWSDQVRRLDRWECHAVPSQRHFFDTYVQPFVAKGQKVFVIVSDALRFEAAAEFAQRLRAANRWSADLDALLGVLPSYTQLGMAALLPPGHLALDFTNNATVSIGGQSATGTTNRAEILGRACGGRATAVQAEEFLAMNSKTDGRELMRDHDVIYVFHNKIDHVGDKAATEAQTLEAVEQAFEELDRIMRKVANINGTNMLLTADHGFLFQQDPVDDGDMTSLPSATEGLGTNRRYLFGRSIASTPAVKIFSAAALGLAGDWSAAFPLSLGRFPLRGSGKRYVHGGISLQEVIVPVVKIHKARSDDTGQVEVEILRMPNKITTGQLAIALFQDRAAAEKVRPRSLRIGLYARDGSAISEQKLVAFDSREEEARLRETTLTLVLSGAADAHNNQDVELRMDEMVQGTTQWVTYRKHQLKLQKPFQSDFDDF